MIKLTTPNGPSIRTHYVSAKNISRITEAGASSQWHGIKTIVRCFDGETLEVSEEAAWIVERVASEKEKP